DEKGVDRVHMMHDGVAQGVDEHPFSPPRERGGTKTSPAYEWAKKVSAQGSPPRDWNLYAFHFSDGDNWGDDVPKCMELLSKVMLPKLNLFGYGQVESPYGSGEFYDHVAELAEDQENVVVSKIPDRDSILGSVKEVLSTGR